MLISSDEEGQDNEVRSTIPASLDNLRAVREHHSRWEDASREAQTTHSSGFHSIGGHIRCGRFNPKQAICSLASRFPSTSFMRVSSLNRAFACVKNRAYACVKNRVYACVNRAPVSMRFTELAPLAGGTCGATVAPAAPPTFF